MFRKLLIPALVVFMLTGAAFMATATTMQTAKAGDAEPLTRAEIKQMIGAYIRENPQEIIDSLDAYEKAAMRAKRDGLVTEGVPMAGNPDGDVTIIEFFDYNCGYCRKVLPTLNELIEDDDGVRVVFREFPILSPDSVTAAKWALAAHEQGKYFEFHNKLMNTSGRVNEASILAAAKAVGIDIDRARADVDSRKVQEHIDQTREIAKALGVSGTPGFVIGDELIPGAVDLQTMKQIIAEIRAQ